MNHGEPCMFLGYPEEKTSNVLKFYNPHTRACLLSRNFCWLNKSYGDHYNVHPDSESIQVNQAHRMMAYNDLYFQDIRKPPSNAVT
jgi:hypothetical protein